MLSPFEKLISASLVACGLVGFASLARAEDTLHEPYEYDQRNDFEGIRCLKHGRPVEAPMASTISESPS